MKRRGTVVEMTIPEGVALDVSWVNDRGQVASVQTYGPLRPAPAYARLRIDRERAERRLARIILAGWGLMGYQCPASRLTRGSIWVSPPGEAGWIAYKGSGPRWLERALNEAGAPK